MGASLSRRPCGARSEGEAPLRARGSVASNDPRRPSGDSSFKRARIKSIRQRIEDRRASRATVVAASGDAMDSTRPVAPLPRHPPRIAARVLAGRRVAPAARLFHTAFTVLLAASLTLSGSPFAGCVVALIVVTHATGSWLLAARVAELPVPCASWLDSEPEPTALRARSKTIAGASGRRVSIVPVVTPSPGGAGATADEPALRVGDSLPPSKGAPTPSTTPATARALAERAGGPAAAPVADGEAGVPPIADARDESGASGESGAAAAPTPAQRMSTLLLAILALGPIASPCLDVLLAIHAARAFVHEASAAGKLPRELVAEARADKDEGDAAMGGNLLRTLAVRRAPVHATLEAAPSAAVAFCILVACAFARSAPFAPCTLAAAVLVSGALHCAAHYLAAVRVRLMLGGWAAYVDEILGRPSPHLMLPLLQLHAGIAHAPMLGVERLASAQRTAQLATALAASPWITAVGVGGVWLPLPRAVRPGGPDGAKLADLGLRDVHARLCAAVLAASACTEQGLDLRVLSLARNRIADSGAAALAALLAARNCRLVALDLSDNRVSDIGAGALAAGVQRGNTLATLLLSNNRVGAEGAAALATACFPRGALRALSLKGNRLGDAGVNAFATAVEDGILLSELDLSDNGASVHAIDDVRKSWRRHRAQALLSLQA
ncbi:hypothetical protein KFE25_002181 [Diacronema lutheri]|uniref:Uncharacterized protein n=1 Tax=Diacronema lutheri TaxID=2081491 RepID=A0A8J5XR80_DIALT|nr:hypothetical protein KFE25_002181 [Diacronema lutheri]